jgi:predicted ATP-dependent endonuclease of OLD family
MPQYITIKNFGPIKNVEKMEVKDFMVFIGERATGKSTIAKLIYFFRYTALEFNRDFYIRFHSNPPFNNLGVLYAGINLNWRNMELGLFRKEDTEIYFYYGNNQENYIKFISGNFIFGSALQRYIENKFEEIEVLRNTTKYSNDNLSKIKIDSYFENLFAENASFFNSEDLIYVPAQRTSIYSSQTNSSLLTDTISTHYRNLIEKCRRNILNKAEVKLFNGYLSYSDKILKGKVMLDSKTDSLILSDNVKIPLSNTSSGQQESSWILIVLQYLVSIGTNNFLVIEEPESHLDPKTQALIMEVIGLYANQIVSDKYNHVIITTHSPYILATVNNLMYAYQVAQMNLGDVTKVVPESLWLDPSRVAAYECKDGGIIDLIAEDGLIKNEELDRASIDINMVHNDLFAIENEVADEL